MAMSTMFRTSLFKMSLYRTVFPAQSRTITTTVNSVFRRPDVPSPRGLFVNTYFLLVVHISLVPGKISTPQDFLKAIGRSSETKISIDSWDAFWRTSGSDMKNAGLSIQDRRLVHPRLNRSSPVRHAETQVYSLVHGEVQTESTNRSIRA